MQVVKTGDQVATFGIGHGVITNIVLKERGCQVAEGFHSYDTMPDPKEPIQGYGYSVRVQNGTFELGRNTWTPYMYRSPLHHYNTGLTGLKLPDALGDQALVQTLAQVPGMIYDPESNQLRYKGYFPYYPESGSKNTIGADLTVDPETLGRYFIRISMMEAKFAGNKKPEAKVRIRRIVELLEKQGIHGEVSLRELFSHITEIRKAITDEIKFIPDLETYETIELFTREVQRDTQPKSLQEDLLDIWIKDKNEFAQLHDKTAAPTETKFSRQGQTNTPFNCVVGGEKLSIDFDSKHKTITIGRGTENKTVFHKINSYSDYLKAFIKYHKAVYPDIEKVVPVIPTKRLAFISLTSNAALCLGGRKISYEDETRDLVGAMREMFEERYPDAFEYLNRLNDVHYVSPNLWDALAISANEDDTFELPYMHSLVLGETTPKRVDFPKILKEKLALWKEVMYQKGDPIHFDNTSNLIRFIETVLNTQTVLDIDRPKLSEALEDLRIVNNIEQISTLKSKLSRRAPKQFGRYYKLLINAKSSREIEVEKLVSLYEDCQSKRIEYCKKNRTNAPTETFVESKEELDALKQMMEDTMINLTKTLVEKYKIPKKRNNDEMRSNQELRDEVINQAKVIGASIGLKYFVPLHYGIKTLQRMNSFVNPIFMYIVGGSEVFKKVTTTAKYRKTNLSEKINE